jgi:hypothetical protein
MMVVSFPPWISSRKIQQHFWIEIVRQLAMVVGYLPWVEVDRPAAHDTMVYNDANVCQYLDAASA